MAAILVVEDERVVARDIEESLERLGYDVVGTAASASECLEHAETRRPDLVLMDVHIEGPVDGVETARILRERFDVPVIFLTAYADEGTVARAREAEPHGYVMKPFRAGELRSAIEIGLFKHASESRARVRERWFSTTLCAIADAVVTVDGEGRVNFVNPVAERLLGHRAEELIGRALEEVFRPIDERTRRSIALPSPSELAAGETFVVGDTAAVVSASGEYPIEDSFAPIVDDGGRVLGAVLVFRDVSESRRLRERAALADRLASLGTLAAGVAHEINNPLTYVLGNASVVSRELERLRDAVKRSVGSEGLLGAVDERTVAMGEALVEIREGAERIRAIVLDLRAFSRPEASGRPGDVSAALAWALRVTEPEILARARLVKRLEPLPLARSSGAHLGQVFLNLLLNAAHAIDLGNTADNRVEVATSVEPGFVVVDVSDTGSGMTPEVAKRIFEPFFTTKPVGKGTGLGLSICHGIVTAAGGSIEVESSPGVGSRFRVRLPIADAAAQLARRPEATGPERRGRILVVDDDAAVASTMRRMLAGHDVVTAASAREASERLAGDRAFELVLCDLAMTDRSGAELYEEIAAKWPELAERVVFVSGGVFTPKLTEFIERVSQPLLAKPFVMAELRAFVQRFLAEVRTRGSGSSG